MDIQELIELKEQEVESQLQQWAVENKVIRTDQRLKCSLRAIIVRKSRYPVDTALTEDDLLTIRNLPWKSKICPPIVKVLCERKNALMSSSELSALGVASGMRREHAPHRCRSNAIGAAGIINATLRAQNSPFRLLEAEQYDLWRFYWTEQR